MTPTIEYGYIVHLYSVVKRKNHDSVNPVRLISRFICITRLQSFQQSFEHELRL